MSCVRKGFACHTLGGRCLIFSWITRSHQSLDPSNLRSSTKRRIPKSPRVSFTNAKISTPTDFSASSGFCFAAAETVPEAPQSVACSSPYKHAQHVGPGTTAQRASVRTFMPACVVPAGGGCVCACGHGEASRSTRAGQVGEGWLP